MYARKYANVSTNKIEWNVHNFLSPPLSLFLSLKHTLTTHTHSHTHSFSHMYTMQAQRAGPQKGVQVGHNLPVAQPPDKAILEEHGETNTYHQLATSDKPAGALTHSMHTRGQNCGHNSPLLGTQHRGDILSSWEAFIIGRRYLCTVWWHLNDKIFVCLNDKIFVCPMTLCSSLKGFVYVCRG